MNGEMLKILMQQFGLDPAALDGLLKTAGDVGQKIESFDARLADIVARLERIEAALIPAGKAPSGLNNEGSHGKH